MVVVAKVEVPLTAKVPVAVMLPAVKVLMVAVIAESTDE